MFKNNSFEDEIYSSMEKSLVKAQTEEQYGFDKLAKAVNYLNSAAAIFEQAGMLTEADEVTEVLQSIAKEQLNLT